MDWRSVWGEEGLAVLPVLVVVAIISAIGFGLVGVMNTDITHATIQGAISRSYFVTQAGLQDAIVQLKANPLYRTAAYPAAVGDVQAATLRVYGAADEHCGLVSIFTTLPIW